MPKRFDHVALAKWSVTAFVVFATAGFAFSTAARRLPAEGSRSELRFEPEQSSLLPGESTTLAIDIEGHQYTVTPRFNYRLKGLAVALSDARSWLNTSHKTWGDYLNTNDLCVIWGANAETLDLSKFDFTHGDWTCYVETSSSEAWSKFEMNGLSNSHVLPSNADIAKQIRDVRVGDQIEITGQLVDYSIDGGRPRTTSTVRTDTGNGACEIIYVTGFRFLERHNEKLYRLAKASLNLAVFSMVVLGSALFILPFLYRRRADEVSTPTTKRFRRRP